MHNDEGQMFRKYVNVRNKIIYPWSLSIIDCFFLYNAFAAISGGISVDLIRVWDAELHEDLLTIGSAYDLYDIDSDAYGSEVALIHRDSNSYCYWDLHERFVIASGSETFMSVARPYPRDVERHRYLEDMENCGAESPEAIYNELIGLR